MTQPNYTRQSCIELLQKKKEELHISGETRAPRRSDFSDAEVVAVKAFLGPWPRALEAAGLKEPRNEDRLQKNREKRARAKKRLRQLKKETKSTNMQENMSTSQFKYELNEIITSILPLDENAMQRAKKHQARLAKPIGSLGRLETLSVQLSGITGKLHNTLSKKALLTFCADNGVVEEGISVSPQSVTLAQAVNLANGKTGAGVLASAIGCEIYVYDVGINGDVPPLTGKVIDKKIAYGTGNIAKGAAMTKSQALQAILTGVWAVKKISAESVDVIGVGELGIGNTTTSAAVLSVLTGIPAKEVTGRGGGLTDDGYRHKIDVIEHAIQINSPNSADIIDVLSKVGGFDIAAMTGAFLGAAFMRIPAVIDGFISAVSALCAVKLCPLTVNYLIPSHASYEIGYRTAMESMELKPLFDLEMRLGEGSGCPIAMSILDAACSVMNHMATFEEAGINDDYLDKLRSIDAFSVPAPISSVKQ